MRTEDGGFAGQWVMLNVAAVLIGYAAYTPLAHGVTGQHGRSLAVPQLLMHSVALGLVALLTFSAQRIALKPHLRVGWRRIGTGVVLFILAFWAG